LPDIKKAKNEKVYDCNVIYIWDIHFIM
jgi:hypothetical protein